MLLKNKLENVSGLVSCDEESLFPLMPDARTDKVQGWSCYADLAGATFNKT